MLNTFEYATITGSSKKFVKGIDFFSRKLKELRRMPSNSVFEWSTNDFLGCVQKLLVNTTLAFMLASRNGFPKRGQK